MYVNLFRRSRNVYRIPFALLKGFVSQRIAIALLTIANPHDTLVLCRIRWIVIRQRTWRHDEVELVGARIAIGGVHTGIGNHVKLVSRVTVKAAIIIYRSRRI